MLLCLHSDFPAGGTGAGEPVGQSQHVRGEGQQSEQQLLKGEIIF
jgi:hypothetical protein